MIFLDSWIWIEFFSEKSKWKEAEHIVARLETEKGIISSVVLMEIRYIFLRKFDTEKADRVIHIIESFANLEITPVTSGVAKYAADLRDKYYQKGKRELSYGDAINLATAILTGCETLYSGDVDFKNIQELTTEII
jgi:predicted nucleic acid-binding protein